MNATSLESPDRLIAHLAGGLAALETAYKDIHAHPELSMQARGLDYASTATAKDANGNIVPVAHACGHDMHVAWLMGVAASFSGSRP
jgi:metal-dependent amidase/aminoacylase/carboxypeptidase family protein